MSRNTESNKDKSPKNGSDDKSGKDNRESGFKLSEFYKKKQNEAFQNSFPIGQYSGKPNTQPNTKTQNEEDQGFINQQKLRFAPKLTDEETTNLARANKGESQMSSYEQERNNQPENILLRASKSGNRMDQMLMRPANRDRKANPSKSNVIFGDTGRVCSFKYEKHSDDDDIVDENNDERNEDMNRFTEEAASKLEGHILPIELPFHLNPSMDIVEEVKPKKEQLEPGQKPEIQEIKPRSNPLKAIHHKDFGAHLKFNSSISLEEKWNLLQIPSDHLLPQIEGFMPSEQEQESLEGINYEDRNALQRHYISLEYDSSGFMIPKKFLNSDNSLPSPHNPGTGLSTKNENLTIGKLKVYKSGKLVMCIGNNKYLIAEGTHVNFKQSVIGLNHSKKRGYFIANIDRKFISIAS